MSIHNKIIEIMKSVEYLKKDDTVGFGNSSYKAISEEKVTSTIRQQLIKHGVTIYPIKQDHKMMDYDGGVNTKGNPVINHMAIVDVTYIITDIDDNSFIEVMSSGTGVDTQDKAVGKAMTYAYKYMLLRTFAIPTGEDPDKISSAETTEMFSREELQNAESRKKLYAIAGVKGYQEEKVKTMCKKKFNEELKFITNEQYNTLYEGFKKLPDKEKK